MVAYEQLRSNDEESSRVLREQVSPVGSPAGWWSGVLRRNLLYRAVYPAAGPATQPGEALPVERKRRILKGFRSEASARKSFRGRPLLLARLYPM